MSENIERPPLGVKPAVFGSRGKIPRTAERDLSELGRGL